MKQVFIILTLFVVNSFIFSVYGQYNDEPEALDLPGDNLNLYAVLDVFQKSKTLEDFETAINIQDNKINNLDLNNDNETDYIRVVSEKKGNAHFIVLQVAINTTEKQDIAVIEVERNKKGEVIVQIIGDKELYGKDYVVEPEEVSKRVGTPNPGYSGNSTTVINNTTNNYNSDYGANVSAWPVMLYLFSPLFITWNSPWRWGYYPSYWRPWRPVYYNSYWGYHSHFYHNHYYRRTVVIRTPYYRSYYSNRRSYSPMVSRNRVNGVYRSTYNGRVYKKPVSPVVRPNVSNRPSGNRPSVPNNGNRPTTLPSNQNTNRPTSRPTARPTTRPAGTRPVTRPTTRPAGENRAHLRGNR